MTTAYTDGACQGNPGPGGWAWAVPDGPFRSGAAAHTTNQRMELAAVLDVVTTVAGPLEVVSDSTYVVNCFKNRWWEGWERRGWKNAQRQEVANQDLWRPLVAAHHEDPARLRFTWVKGHSGDTMNDLVDRLAVEAAARQTGREGTGVPDGLGPPDRPGSARPRPTGAPGPARAAGPVPPVVTVPGHRVVVTGLKAADLGGYGETLAAASLRGRLTEILAAKSALHDGLVVLTGLGLGSESIGAEAAAAADVPYVAVLAFAGQDARWPPESRRRFAELLAAAAQVVVLTDDPVGDAREAGARLTARDRWLADNADEAVVVWDRREPWVARTVAALEAALGEDEVWLVEP